MAGHIGLSIKPHNDIYLAADGNLAMARDADAIAEHARQRLKFWLAEWWLNTDAGVDWTRYVLGRPPQEIQIAEAVIKKEILETPGVTGMLEFSASYERASRGLRIDRCVVTTIYGEAEVL